MSRRHLTVSKTEVHRRSLPRDKLSLEANENLWHDLWIWLKRWWNYVGKFFSSKQVAPQGTPKTVKMIKRDFFWTDSRHFLSRNARTFTGTALSRTLKGKLFPLIETTKFAQVSLKLKSISQFLVQTRKAKWLFKDFWESMSAFSLFRFSLYLIKALQVTAKLPYHF